MSSFQIMGIVNVTPDSFSDGGRYSEAARAVEHGLQLVEEGAHILDIGGESTRPGADDVPVEEEIARVVPVIEGLVKHTSATISIDTRKPVVARAAHAAGAHIWNDVSALTWADDSLESAAELAMPVVLMHAQGDPKTMQQNPVYGDVVEEVTGWLGERIEACIAGGLPKDRLIVDPGIGFGKTVAHNLALLAGLDRLTTLGCPVLLGASRKRFISAIDRDMPANDRLGGSIASVLAGASRGATMFRVHDVAATRQALAMFSAIESH
ncbi:dihydropteroate synthase [Parvularcula flava]|uniref:Dihydropteroate synthase n=1 Tax=Aquisalinus luteolus TaxID=1566827 RepID=A0A8J3A3W9_9PROT|nr:dihydropteroate synthase [Aquisalinus luteolus]NHK29309.1 dihydropteroate synthase [Aquisalinus luteolus]GGI01170.1 dihydropteroate synthase [Aquisalinus luteolus]